MAASYRDVRVEGRTGSGFQDANDGLPNGHCNFRNLTAGRAPTCGCKKFWLNTTNIDSRGEKEFCFCGHHACFHSWTSQMPRASAHPSSNPVQNAIASQVKGRDTPPGYYAVRHAGAGGSPKPSTGLGIRQDGRDQSQSQSINTRVWEALNGFARNQDDGCSDTNSKLPSTAVPSENGDPPPQSQRPMPPPVNIPLSRAGFEEYQGSATEVATPSVQGTPDLQAFAPPGTQSHFSPARAPPPMPPQQNIESAIQQQLSQNAANGISMSTQDMRIMLQELGRRLDVVESLSFSHVPVEEVQDKFENHDLRMLEIEQWRAERDQERQQASPEPLKASSSNQPLIQDEAASFGSDDSYDSRAAAHTEAAVLATIAANMENGPRFDALENRLADLESASLPSYTRPWQVQVVLLPWGRDLRGIWFSSSESTQQSQQSAFPDSEEWTGPQSSAKTSFHSTTSAAWTTDSIQAWAEDAQDWLSAKACGPTGSVFQRLASRGLVKDVTFTASDSRHIWDTIARGFRKVLPRAPSADSDLTDQYQGLREGFLPLRKVRKSTRLRFLSPAEMITSAIWNACFVDESVMMKVHDGQRRLYITTPHAYLQSSKNGLSWQLLRELPPRNANGEALAAQVDRDVAIEACWSYKDKLDYAPSLHSSFGSHATHRSLYSSHSGQGAQQPQPDEDPDNDHPMSPLSEARPQRLRTVSLPSSSSAPHEPTSSSSATKRRIASFESALPSNATVDQALQTTNLKRRRLSTSPETERRGVNFTPRWSREPPSPFHSDGMGLEANSQGATSSGFGRAMCRAMTPAAYATPHSNSHFVGLAELVGNGDGDTELGTDLAEHEAAEEEWEGVGEGADASAGAEDEDEEMGEDGDSDGESEVDDDDLEEGLTIYER